MRRADQLFQTMAMSKLDSDINKNSRKGPKFLIVDDEPFNLVALEGLLEHLHIRLIDKSMNGRDALQIVRNNP